MQKRKSTTSLLCVSLLVMFLAGIPVSSVEAEPGHAAEAGES